MPDIRGVVALAALTVLLAGGTDGGGSATDGEPGPAETFDPEARPEVEIPDGAPPDALVVDDLVEGDGSTVGAGALVTVHYVGLTWSGSEFVSSWERGQPLTYEHGQGRWVEGWETGIQGMEVGGRRRIVVPPELGYGSRGAPGVAPGETLVFVVDLLDVS